jgi:RNA polymerase sigma-70 factor (ECF subfamily)
LDSLTDEDLAVRVQQGSREAFEALVDRYGPRLLRFLHRKAGSLQDAEDLVQETFVRVYRYVHRYCPDRGFSTWLYTIAARLASTHRRRVRPAPAYLDAEGPVEPSPLDRVSQREDKASLWTLAKTLSENQYEVLWLRYAEGMQTPEIARVTGKSEVHVRVLLFRARANMAKRLQAVTEEPSQAQPGGGRSSLVETAGD